MRKINLLIILISSLFASNTLCAEQSLASIDQERGFFSLGLAVGTSKSGLQNESGSYSGYQSSILGVDLGFNIWGSGPGQVSIIGSYLMGDGKNNSNLTDKIKNQETTFGVKLGISSILFLSASTGTNKVSLSSTANSNELSISNNITKLALGIEYPISDTFYFGLEISYRTGPVKKSDNPDLSSSTTYEGSAGLIKLIWSPPSITNNFSVRKLFN